MEKQCSAETKRLKRCERRAGSDGFCSAHTVRTTYETIPDGRCCARIQKRRRCRNPSKRSSRFCSTHCLPPNFDLPTCLMDMKRRLNDHQFRFLTGEMKEVVQRWHKTQWEKQRWIPTPREAKQVILDDVLIGTGYNRVVVGDHGIFIEFLRDQMKASSFVHHAGQEYRVRLFRAGQSVPYFWLETNESGLAPNKRTPIYYQTSRVPYADFRVGCFYINAMSPRLRIQ